MADAARDVFSSGEDSLRQGAHEAALRSYLRVVRAAPTFWRARLRVADALLALKARNEALTVYKALAWHAIKSGQPLTGLVALKIASALDPNEREAIAIVAQLYCQGSDRIDASRETAPRPSLSKEDKAGPEMTLSGPVLLAAAAHEAADTATMGKYPDRLPAIPLFNLLDEDAFVAVLGSLELRRFEKDQVIIREGQPGDSFFLLAEGTVDVSRTVGTKAGPKTVQLGQMHPGAVFGEMALISRAPRTATVIACEACDLLELKREALEDQAHKLESVTAALKTFTDERFLANLTATSPVFKPFPRSIRIEIMKKFRHFPINPGDELISEGEAGQGLFLILKGHVEVFKHDPDGTTVQVATLREGDVFGEIALLQDTPTTATVTAASTGELLFLPRKEFVSTMLRHPEFKDELGKLTAERIAKDKQRLGTENFVLIDADDLIML